MIPMDEQHIRIIALHAVGEYLMKHISGVMGIVEDKHTRNKETVLNEEALVMVEAQVKAIAQELAQQSREIQL